MVEARSLQVAAFVTVSDRALHSTCILKFSPTQEVSFSIQFGFDVSAEDPGVVFHRPQSQ